MLSVNIPSQIDLKDFVTTFCDVLGAGLGIYNALHSRLQKRVKLKVVPKVAIPVRNGRGMLNDANPFREQRGLSPQQEKFGCIEVTNLSSFAVTVDDVGFTIKGDPRKNRRASVLQHILLDGRTWPCRLEPRTAVTAYFDLNELRGHLEKAYALTECGAVGYGSSPALEGMKKQALR